MKSYFCKKNSDGKYERGLSSGWDVKSEALDNAWEDINEQITAAKKAIIAGEKSPIYYFFVKQGNTQLAERILFGLHQAKQDGSFDELFFSVPEFKQGWDTLKNGDRRLIELK
mgnify:CR=1 FL=1